MWALYVVAYVYIASAFNETEQQIPSTKASSQMEWSPSLLVKRTQRSPMIEQHSDDLDGALL